VTDLTVMVIIPLGIILQNPTLKKYAKRRIVSTKIYYFVSTLSTKIITFRRKNENQVVPATATQKVYFINLTNSEADNDCVILH
jgi:hypothetical protein